MDVGRDADEEDGNRTSSTGIPDSEPGPSPAAIPVPDSPSLSVQLPPPRGPSGNHPDWESSCGMSRLKPQLGSAWPIGGSSGLGIIRSVSRLELRLGSDPI